VIALLVAALSGWVLIVLVAATIVLPYVLRTPELVTRDSSERVVPYLVRLRPHYWIGYAIAVLGAVHALAAMSAGGVAVANVIGIYLATAALLVVLLQVRLGLELREPRLQNRRTVRGWHFRAMLAIAALGVAHVVLNSVLVRVLGG
jgi:hypothetical protein